MDNLYVPTLAELINECRGSFEYMAQDDEGQWIATARGFNADPDIPRGEGSTPEIAVARLWLALNT